MNSLAPQSVTEAKQLRKSVNLSQDPKAADALNSALGKDGAVSVTLPSVGAEVEQPLPQSTDNAAPGSDLPASSDAPPSSPPIDEFKFGETDIASQPPLQYDVKESDEETEEKFLYKKGVLLYSCSANDRADIITAMKIDGDIAFFGTHGGKVIGWDLKQNSQVCSVDIKPPESSEPEDADDPLKDRDTPEAKMNDDDEKRDDQIEDGEAEKRESNNSQNIGGRLLSVSCIEVNSGSLLVGASTGQVGVWSLQTGVCSQIWHDHSERVTAIKLMDNNAYTVSHDGFMLVRDIEQNKILHSYVNCTCPISCMVIQEPHLLLVGSWDGAIRQLDLKTQKVTMELRHPDHSPVRAMTLHPETQLLICSHGSGNITSWDLRAESVFIENYAGHSAVVNSLIVHNNRLYTASDDKTVRVWDLAKGLCLDALSGHDDGVSSMEVSEDTLLTSSYDGTVRAYKLSSIEAAVDLRKRRLEEGRRISQELWLKHKEEARARKQKKGKEKKAKPAKK